MDDAFVQMMQEFVHDSIEDRKGMKKCLIDIKLQLKELTTQSKADAKNCDVRKEDCEKIHQDFENRIRHIPTKKEKENIEERIKSLEKLKPFIYKITGVLIFLSVIAIPVCKKLGIL